ncbi:MAG TPA: PorP/SprF family type IX secretion system membrane protein, partial [Catalimonadaceae bacterium]|nr:PorP/SprF family type IX secretion system membrane protein [Catalimonadaceae bacterium]
MKTNFNQLNSVKKFLSFCFTVLVFQAYSQQLYYSQYQLTPMLNNPSLIALSEEIKIDAGYRNQFGGKGGNYSTPLFAGYMPIYKESVQNQFTKLGAGGIQLFTDRTGYGGMLATTGFSITYAHLVQLSAKDKLSFGLTPGFFQRRVDFSGLKSGSQWDSFYGEYKEQLPLNEEIAQTERRTFLTINSGLTYLRERSNGDQFFTFSVAANNLTRPNISLNSKSFSNPVGWNIQSSIVAFEDDQFIVKPTFRHIQVRNLSQTNIGSYF